MKHSRILSRREFSVLGGGAAMSMLAATPYRTWGESLPGFNLGHFDSANPQTYARACGSLANDLRGKTTVNFLTMSSAPQFLAAMAGGSLDSCAISSSAMISAFTQGLQVSLVYIEKVINTSEALIVRNASGITKLADLKGRRIGTPLNTSAHFALLCALGEAHLGPADVEIINMRPDSLPAAWSRGAIDAAYIWHPFQDQLVAAGGRVLMTTADLQDMGVLLFDGIIVRNEFKRKHPDILLAYLKNYAATCEAFRRQQPTVVATLSTFMGLPNEAVRQYVSTFATLTPAEILSAQWMGPVGARNTGVSASLHAQSEYLRGAKQIEGAPKDFDRFIDSSFVTQMV